MKLAQKGLGVFLSNWAVLPLQFVTGVLVVRALGAEGKGVLVIFTTGITLLSAIGQLGLPNAATYLVRKEAANARMLLAHYLLILVAFTALAAGGLLLARESLWRLLFEGTEARPVMLPLLLFILPLSMATNFLAALLLAQGQAKEYAKQTVGLGVLNMVFTVVLVVWLRLGVAGGLAALALAQAFNVAFIGRRILRATAGQSTAFAPSLLREMLRLGLQNYLVTLGSLVLKRIDTFLVQAFLGTAAVGIYSVARVPFDTVLTVPRAVSGLVAGEASGADTGAAGTLVAKVTRNVLWIMLAVVAPIALGAPWVVPAFYGPRFAAAVPALEILLAASVLFGVAISLQTYFVGVGKPGLNARFTLVAGLANAGLSCLLIPQLGLVGNALACLAGTLLLAGLQAGWFLRLAGGRWPDMCRLELADLRALVAKLQRKLHRPKAVA